MRWDELDGTSTTVGRSPDGDLVIEGSSVSRSHAEIWDEQGTFRIKDLGSSNGTLVHGKRVVTEALFGIQFIRLGNVDVLLLESSGVERKL